MRTFIPPQKKLTEEKIEVRVESAIASMLKDYAEFLDSPLGYVVTEVLRKVFRKDKAFLQWREGREPAAKSKNGRGGSMRRAPVPDASGPVAASPTPGVN